MYNSNIINFSKDKNAETEIKTAVTDDAEEIQEDKEISSEEPQRKLDDEFSELSDRMDNEADEIDTGRITGDRSSPENTDDSEEVTITYPNDGLFHIIVGSFRNKNYAEKFSTDMKRSGFKSKIISQPTGMHAVTLGSFLSRKEAVDSMNVWKSQHPNIWILSQ